MLLEEYFRQMSENSDSIWAAMKKSEQRKQCDDAVYILEHLKTVPGVLYKYRSCNEYNFEALENNSIWVSSAESFLDPYDCRLPFSIKDLSTRKINKLMKWFVFSEYIYGYKKENLVRFEDALTPNEARKLFFSSCYNNELYFNVKAAHKFVQKNYQKEHWNKVLKKIMLFDELISRRGRGKKLRDWFKADCEKGCIETIESSRKARLVCSMTETNNNPKMWEEYASNYSGFCIGYDLSQGLRVDALGNMGLTYALKGLLPVFYIEKRPKFNSYKFQLIQYKDTFYEIEDENWTPNIATKLFMQMLIKNPKYSNEQEWRIVVGGDTPGLIWFPFATGIYMGKDIANEDKERLMQIARKNNLTVYQQKVGVASFEYEIVRLAEPREIIGSRKIVIPNAALD